MTYWLEKLGLGSLLLLVLNAAGAQAQAFEVTVGNAVDLGAQWAEITTAAIGPGENQHCPGGRLFFADGDGVLATDPNGQAVVWPDPQGSPNPRIFAYRETFPPHVIADNHLVKLKDGSLVYTVEAITWNDNVSPKPAWWQRTVEFPVKGLKRPGGRAIIYVRRSQDCGGTWTRAQDIDAATLMVPATAPAGRPTRGLCGHPQLLGKITPKGEVRGKRAEGGGWDGHFLYADPYNGNLFLSVGCNYGTEKVNVALYRALMLMSADRGDSWRVIGQIDTQNDAVRLWRMPVTSLPSGQVALGYENWKFNQLKLTTFGPPYEQVDLTQAKVVTALSHGQLAPGHGLNARPRGYPTLARLPGKGFLVSAADWQKAGPWTKQMHRFFEVRRPALPGQGPLELPKIEAPGNNDMIQGTLIEGTPATDLHVFYWLERIPVITTAGGKLVPNRFQVRFQAFKGATALLKQPGVLTIAEGKPYTYGTGPVFVGDYMGGASYAGKDGSLHFVTPWSEQGVLRFNTISLSPLPLGANAPAPVDVQIVPQPVPVQRLVKPVPVKEGRGRR